MQRRRAGSSYFPFNMHIVKLQRCTNASPRRTFGINETTREERAKRTEVGAGPQAGRIERRLRGRREEGEGRRRSSRGGGGDPRLPTHTSATSISSVNVRARANTHPI